MIEDMDLLAFGPSDWGERQLARLIDCECVRSAARWEACAVDTLRLKRYRSVAPHRGFMQHPVSFTLETYTPAEAGSITGVAPALQRDWRRRGLLPESEGNHARYYASGLAEMVLMKDFSEEGLGPKLLRDIMMMSALPLVDWVNVMASLQANPDRVIPDEEMPPRYVVYSGDHAFRTNDLNRAFENLSDRHNRRFGFVCDLRKVAEQVVQRLPRPVWRRSSSAETGGSNG